MLAAAAFAVLVAAGIGSAAATPRTTVVARDDDRIIRLVPPRP